MADKKEELKLIRMNEVEATEIDCISHTEKSRSFRATPATEIPPRFTCQNCKGEMIPEKYEGVHGIQYEY